jgi:hypothetical protein
MTITDDMVKNCVRFVQWALQEGPWSGGDLDGASVQDMAESMGLIVSVPYDPEKHGAYNEYGCDAGDPWFEFAPGLKAAALEGSVAVPAWQPIEAAPMERALFGYWTNSEKWYCHVFDSPEQPITYGYTHWRPMPEPPAIPRHDGKVTP